MTTNYDELSERAERGELSVKAETVRKGQEAVAAARRSLAEAAGTADLEELSRIVLGRPPLGAEGGASPVVRARVPQSMKDTLAALAQRDHRRESDIVREALAAYLEARTAA